MCVNYKRTKYITETINVDSVPVKHILKVECSCGTVAYYGTGIGELAQREQHLPSEVRQCMKNE